MQADEKRRKRMLRELELFTVSHFGLRLDDAARLCDAGMLDRYGTRQSVEQFERMVEDAR